MKENGKYFRGKHHVYASRTKVSVSSDGKAIGCSQAYLGAISDVAIFTESILRNNCAFQQIVVQKI